jgi:hypothetical protein
MCYQRPINNLNTTTTGPATADGFISNLNANSEDMLGHKNIHTPSQSSLLYFPKMCARHRVPSVCSSETASRYTAPSLMRRIRKNTFSHASNQSAAELTSSVDLNEFKSHRSAIFYKRKRSISQMHYSTSTSNAINAQKNINRPQASCSTSSFKPIKDDFSKKMLMADSTCRINEENSANTLTRSNAKVNEVDSLAASSARLNRLNTNKPNAGHVHFHLNGDEEIPHLNENAHGSINTSEDPNNCNNGHYYNLSIRRASLQPPNQHNTLVHKQTTQTNGSTVIGPVSPSMTSKLGNNITTVSQLAKSVTVNSIAIENNQQDKAIDKSQPNAVDTIHQSKQIDSPSEAKNKFAWDTYWDSLELNALGKLNT